MERGNLLRWLLLGVGIFLLISVGKNLFGGNQQAKRQPVRAREWRFAAMATTFIRLLICTGV